MGVLLGGFIEGDPAKLEGATSYLAFIVPGLVAAHAMQIAVGETTYPVMGALKWHKTYYSMIATPLEPRHLVAANLMFVLFRLATACGGLHARARARSGSSSRGGDRSSPSARSCSSGWRSRPWSTASATRIRSEQAFGVLFRLGVLPLTLFSGAFFPIANLGPVLEWVARLTPLWHGVNLSRMFCLDTVDWSTAAINVAVLVA